MASVAPTAAAVPRTYADLRRSVEEVIGRGRQSIEVAWVRTYHETGRLISEHLLLNQVRADYGAKVIARLSDETRVSRRTLHECVQFYRCFPIVRPGAQLAWNQYRLLCQVADPKVRSELMTQIEKRDWNKADLEARVRAINAGIEATSEGTNGVAKKSTLRILKPRQGTPGLYRVVRRDGGLAGDVGFKLYLPLSSAEARGVAAGAIVRWGEDGFSAAKEASSAELFTYQATVRRVLDGDTLLMTIALPHYGMDEKLRLRGLDCPEMDTAEGRAAKRFVDVLLADAESVTITTSKVDKYDRYLADVHVRRSSGEEVFLNNALLENGHAVPMGAEEMTDWVP